MILHRDDRLNYCEFEPSNVCSVAAAILGGSAISAGASYFGSKNASDAQTNAMMQGLALQREMFGKAENALSPFINMGKEGIEGLQNWFNPGNEGGPLAALLKLTMPGADMSETLAQTPGYQFAENRGLKAVDNALAKRGLAGSGGAVSKGAGDFVTGLASGTWGNVVNALQGILQSGGAGLSGIVGQGLQAGGALAGNATGAGNAMAGTMTNIGNAQGAGIMGQWNALGGLGNGVSNAYLTNQLMSGGAVNGGDPRGYGNAANNWNPNVGGGVYSGSPAGEMYFG